MLKLVFLKLRNREFFMAGLCKVTTNISTIATGSVTGFANSWQNLEQNNSSRNSNVCS